MSHTPLAFHMCVPQEPAARITAVNALQHRFLADRPLIHSQLGRVKMRIDVPECDDEEGELQAPCHPLQSVQSA